MPASMPRSLVAVPEPDPIADKGPAGARGFVEATGAVPAASVRAALSGADLRRRTARGTVVNSIFEIALSALSLLKGFIVAAFLSASQFGVWGVLVVALGTLLWLKQVGVSDRYVQQDEVDQERAFQVALTIEALFTAIFIVVLVAAVPLMALAYGRPELLAPGFALVLVMPAAVLQAPLWVYYRDMAFVRQRTLAAVDPVVGFVVTIALAVAGAGYWSLVAGVIAGAWASAVVAMRSSPYPLRLRWQPGALSSYTSFSWPLLVAGASGLVIAQVSVLLGQATLGLAGVGAITLAAMISGFADGVDRIVTGTLYPAICAVRDRRDLLFESFQKSNRLALMWGVPFGVGVALFAPDLVHYVLGDRWHSAIGLIEVFGLIAAADQVGYNWDAFFRARGVTRPMAAVAAATMAAYLAVGVPLLVLDGLAGLAIGMGVAAACGLIGRTLYLTRLFPAHRMARHAARALAPSIPAVAVVLAARQLEPAHRSLALAVGELALYLAVTAVATVRFERGLLRELGGYLRAPGVRRAVS
jgi:polysaccharide transporter, PST family